MIRLIIVLTIVLSISGCLNKYSKDGFVSAKLVNKQFNVFDELYELDKGSAYANSTYSYYLTDSINFRKFVGVIKYDDEWYKSESKGNDIFCYHLRQGANEPDTVNIQKYDISSLIEQGKFD